MSYIHRKMNDFSKQERVYDDSMQTVVKKDS